jgi:hypothetical protein
MTGAGFSTFLPLFLVLLHSVHVGGGGAGVLLFHAYFQALCDQDHYGWRV